MSGGYDNTALPIVRLGRGARPKLRSQLNRELSTPAINLRYSRAVGGPWTLALELAVDHVSSAVVLGRLAIRKRRLAPFPRLINALAPTSTLFSTINLTCGRVRYPAKMRRILSMVAQEQVTRHEGRRTTGLARVGLMPA